MPFVDDGQLSLLLLVWLSERAVVGVTQLVVPDLGGDSAHIEVRPLHRLLHLPAVVVYISLVYDALSLRKLVHKALGLV